MNTERYYVIWRHSIVPAGYEHRTRCFALLCLPCIPLNALGRVRRCYCLNNRRKYYQIILHVCLSLHLHLWLCLCLSRNHFPALQPTVVVDVRRTRSGASLPGRRIHSVAAGSGGASTDERLPTRRWPLSHGSHR